MRHRPHKAMMLPGSTSKALAGGSGDPTRPFGVLGCRI